MSAATSKMYGHRRGNNYNVCTIKYVREKKDPECWKKPCLFPSESFTEFTYLLPASWTEHKDKVKSLVGATLFGAGWQSVACALVPGSCWGGGGSMAALLYIPSVLFGQWIVRVLVPAADPA